MRTRVRFLPSFTYDPNVHPYDPAYLRSPLLQRERSFDSTYDLRTIPQRADDYTKTTRRVVAARRPGTILLPTPTPNLPPWDRTIRPRLTYYSRQNKPTVFNIRTCSHPPRYNPATHLQLHGPPTANTAIIKPRYNLQLYIQSNPATPDEHGSYCFYPNPLSLATVGSRGTEGATAGRSFAGGRDDPPLVLLRYRYERSDSLYPSITSGADHRGGLPLGGSAGVL